MSSESSGYRGDVVNWLRGLCMGAADIVPGVSGGTMALILGHYERLVGAISRIDSTLFGLLRRRQFRAAAEHMDLRFLIALGLGMVSGVVALASLMHYLLEHQLPYTYAVFTGLILASSYLVARRLTRLSASSVVSCLVGGLFAWQICVQQPVQSELTVLSAFLAATVAICAMILPGISGAFVLLLLGLYHPVTDLIKGLPKGEFTFDGLLIIAAFLLGCLTGLLAFSRILKWLLAKHHDRTLAFLVGLMLGSLYKIWPFQTVTPETAGLAFKEQVFVHSTPSGDIASVAGVVALVMLAAVGTMVLEKVGARFAPTMGNGAEAAKT